MNLVELKCPNCGGNLELQENGFARCTFCGQIVALDEEPKTNININFVKEENKDKTKKYTYFKWVMIVITIVSITFVGVIMLVFVGSFIQSLLNHNNIEANIDGLTMSRKCNQLFLSDVFGKDYKSITQEEKNSIKYLSVGYQDGNFVYEYSFHDYSEYSDEEEFRETTKVWSIETTNLPWSNDFTDFNGLTRFDYELSISQIRFSEDCKLKYVTCSGDIKDLLKSVPVSQIEVLVISTYGETLDGIEEFDNLTTLTLKSSGMTDISKLANCSYLKELILESDLISDFESLNSLTQLEELTLSCEELRTLDFVENMGDLKSLNILSGTLYDVASLKGLKNLKSLSLDADFESDNFEVIGTLTNLESLDIDVNIDNMDFLKELKNMKKLNISYLEDFNVLTPMKNLEELNLFICDYDNAYLLSENKKLRSLTINHGFGMDILDLGFLSDVKTLEEINIYGDDFIPRRCKNLETVLDIPSLEAVKVYGIDILMDLKHIKRNRSLKTLDFQIVSISNMDSSGEVEEMELSNSLKFVMDFPNLEVVTVKSSKLTSIEWVKHLKNLRELDVTDNYISDFSALNTLSKLERLVCSENAKTNVKLDNEEVEIICIETE